MAEHPGPIRRGVGKFTPRLWDRLMTMLVSWEADQEGRQARSLYPPLRRWEIRPPIMAIVYGELATEFATNRWRYPWQQAKLTGTTWAVNEEGLAYDASDTDTWALNTVEASNDGLGVEAPGVNIEQEPYLSSGFSLQPISGQPVVPLHFFRDTGNVVRYVFSLANAHDGTCT